MATLTIPVPGVRPHSLLDAAAALAWFDTENACLLAAHRTATTRSWHDLAWALQIFLSRRRHRHDRLAVWQAAADAAIHLPDPTTCIHAHRLLGVAQAELSRHEDAIEHLHQALTLAEHHHDPTYRARIHHGLAQVWERRGDYRQALRNACDSLEFYRELHHPVASHRAERGGLVRRPRRRLRHRP